MNRRDFIGAAIGTLVAALALPFEEFAAWCKRWVGAEECLAGLSSGPGYWCINRVTFHGPPVPVRLAWERAAKEFGF